MSCLSSGDCVIGQPMAAPTAAASSMIAEANARASGSSRIRSQLAPVKAEIGFMVMLPHSLYHMSYRISLAWLASKPAVARTFCTSVTAVASRPPAAPMIMPLPITWRTTPGLSTEQEACTTPPMTRSVGSAFSHLPSGSTERKGWAARLPSADFRNHQGTPFMAGSSRVDGPIMA